MEVALMILLFFAIVVFAIVLRMLMLDITHNDK